LRELIITVRKYHPLTEQLIKRNRNGRVMLSNHHWPNGKRHVIWSWSKAHFVLMKMRDAIFVTSAVGNIVYRAGFTHTMRRREDAINATHQHQWSSSFSPMVQGKAFIFLWPGAKLDLYSSPH